jgi:hypothetical protein
MNEPHNDHQEVEITPAMSRLAQNRFIIMIVTSITLALLLVAVAMALYSSSGTAQLDLSRPGYVSVRDQIKSDDTFNGFSSSGSVDEKTLDSFKQMFDKRAKDAVSVDAFSSDVLSDSSLGLDDVPVEE